MDIKELQKQKEELLAELRKLKETKADKFEKYRARKISNIAKAEMEEPETEAPETEDEEEYVVMEEFYNKIDYVINLMYQMTNNIWANIDNLYVAQMEHCNNGHLPKLTAGQLEKLLKAAGAENDFQVEKKTVWAGRHLVAEIKKKG